MISSVSFENFKQFKRIKIDDFKQITLIGGKNSSGKTSILEGMFLFFDRLNPNKLIRLLNWRGIDSVPLESKYIWAPIFYNYNLTNNIKIEVISDNQKEILDIKYLDKHKTSIKRISPIESGRPIVKTDQPSIEVQALEMKYSKGALTSHESKLIMGPDGFGMQVAFNLGKLPTAVFLAARAKISQQEDSERLGSLEVEGKTNTIIDILRVIEPSIQGLSTITIAGDPVIYADIGAERKIPVSYMGDGISRLLSLSLAISSNVGGVLFVDEIENGIHYSVMPKIFEALMFASKTFNCQLIATTHSYELLKSVKIASENTKNDNISYVRISKTSTGITSKSFSHEDFKFALESDLEIR